MSLEKELQNNYLMALQPNFMQLNKELQSAAEVAGTVGKNIASSVKESAQEYGQYMANTPAKESIPTTMSELGKGLLAGVGGIVGDTEQLISGIYEVLKTPEGKSKLEALIKGLEKETIAPTSGDVESMIEKKVGATPKGADFPEGVGLITAPVGTVIKGAKASAKAVKSLSNVSKDVLPSASKVTTQPIETKTIETKPIETKPIVEQKDKPIWAKETLSINQMKRLVPEGTSENLYRQMSNSLLSDLLLSGRNAASNSNSRMTDDLYFATSKEYAIGQGANAKGPVVTFKSFDTLVPKQRVAAHDFIKEQTGIPPEVVIEDARDLRQVRDRIISIEFPKGSDKAINIRDGKSPYSIINRLQSEQWKKTIMDDGKIILTPPTSKIKGK